MEEKTPEAIKLIRESASINALAHEAVRELLAPGITTKELDAAADKVLRKHGAESSFRHLYGFPCSICISINEEVAHGIPSERTVEPGDLVKVDIGALYRNYHSDCAVTHSLGPRSDRTLQMVSAAKEALANGIAHAMPGHRVSDISHAIFSTVDQKGFHLIRHAFSHGVGRNLHEEPQIALFGQANRGPRLQPGVVLAIEPVVAEGTRYTYTKSDGWTTATIDGSCGAHFEHTVLVTEDGPEILTKHVSEAQISALQEASGIGGGFRFRTADSNDIEFLFQMAARNMNRILLEAWGRPAERGIFHETGAQTVVIETVSGEAAGFYTSRTMKRRLELITLVIDEPFQGKGIGRAVMDRIQKETIAAGLSAIDLCVQSNNERARRLYETLGYKYLSTPYYNTLSMRKDLHDEKQTTPAK